MHPEKLIIFNENFLNIINAQSKYKNTITNLNLQNLYRTSVQ